MSITPTLIKRIEGKGVLIRWSDGSTSELSSSVLRTQCPCAMCREKRGEGSHDTPLTPAPQKKRSLSIVQNSLSEELDLTQVWPIGNYALGIRWGDGHDTGLYTFEYLRELTGMFGTSGAASAG
jgi:DUF971 family protein